MANVAMELLESSLETRLENTFHIKAKLSECADKQRIEIVASLLYAYDQVRQLHEIHSSKLQNTVPFIKHSISELEDRFCGRGDREQHPVVEQ